MRTDNMYQILISGKPEFAQEMVQTKDSSAIFLLSVCFKLPCTFLVNDGPFAPAVLCPGKYLLRISHGTDVWILFPLSYRVKNKQ